jgi:hypothetical protein
MRVHDSLGSARHEISGSLPLRCGRPAGREPAGGTPAPRSQFAQAIRGRAPRPKISEFFCCEHANASSAASTDVCALSRRKPRLFQAERQRTGVTSLSVRNPGCGYGLPRAVPCSGCAIAEQLRFGDALQDVPAPTARTTRTGQILIRTRQIAAMLATPRLVRRTVHLRADAPQGATGGGRRKTAA